MDYSPDKVTKLDNVDDKNDIKVTAGPSWCGSNQIMMIVLPRIFYLP
jgi:hypothetical protein